jgi:integrase
MGRKLQPTHIPGRLDGMNIDALPRGLHGDGNRLYLQCTPGADSRMRRSWIFRFSIGGREKQLGLGSFEKVGTQDARRAAQKHQEALERGEVPEGDRERNRALRAQERQQRVASITFDQCAAKYIETHRPEWRNAKHAAQWQSTLNTYASPVFGNLPVREIERQHLIEALEPIWKTKRETARRVRGRIEAVLDWAEVREYRTGANPARLSRAQIQAGLGKQPRTIRHHAAVPYQEIGAFMRDLKSRESVAASALEFTILTAARTNEALQARDAEFDLKAHVWTVPAGRMKGKREHRVPLSDAACDVLRRMAKVKESDVVFPGERQATLSNMAMLAVLKRMGRGDLTVHGFRSTFRDWAAECTNFPREVAEAALAHVVGDKVEAAYRRGDLFEKRRKLMDAWAAYCAKPATSGKVIPLPTAEERIPA